MCGRFSTSATTDELIREFAAAGSDYEDWRPTYSFAPKDVMPIIRERRDKETGEIRRTLDPAFWDFRPAFNKKPRDEGKPQFNATIENLTASTQWRPAFTKTRAMVPMDGYFEFESVKQDGKPIKQPHYLHGDRPILAAAAIYTLRKFNDEWEVSAAIVTREARDASGEVHPRMPALLTPDLYDEWLNPAPLETDDEKEHLIDVLSRVSAEMAATLKGYVVDRKFNNTHTVDRWDPTLLDPIDESTH